jgi:hypothetical protein
VPGCTIPLWPHGENTDEDGYDMRVGSDLIHDGLSYSQVCFWCNTVLCRYHLSSPITFAEKWCEDFQQDNFYPLVARLCSKCLMNIEIEYVMWLDDELFGPDTIEKKFKRLNREKG